ncbi:hypothetical protein Mapa_001771 [Marchantia paleacea]|nr:hypothetical protein Mapa_001771 [Marchantia paleacea]
MLPFKRLLLSTILTTLLSPPRKGNTPDRKLPPKSMICRLPKEFTDSGIKPCSWFRLRSSCRRLTRLPISEGIVPPIPVSVMDNLCKLVKLPKESGSVPPSSGLS